MNDTFGLLPLDSEMVLLPFGTEFTIYLSDEWDLVTLCGQPLYGGSLVPDAEFVSGCGFDRFEDMAITIPAEIADTEALWDFLDSL